VSEKHGVNELAERAFRRHYGQVYRYVRRRTPDHYQAEELTQQVFADAAASLQEGPSPALAWLYTVAKRRFADEARRGAVTRRARDRMLAVAVASETHDYGPDLAATLHAAIEHLPQGQREVVVLKLLRGARFAEIGARLGISPDAAKMRFVRGLDALRAELEEEGLGP
jgi:RNA polymerase sigma-70 factor (ECF subfamily)